MSSSSSSSSTPRRLQLPRPPGLSPAVAARAATRAAATTSHASTSSSSSSSTAYSHASPVAGSTSKRRFRLPLPPASPARSPAVPRKTSAAASNTPVHSFVPPLLAATTTTTATPDSPGPTATTTTAPAADVAAEPSAAEIVTTAAADVTATSGATTTTLPPGWVELHADDGTPYYLNEADGTTSWDAPSLANGMDATTTIADVASSAAVHNDIVPTAAAQTTAGASASAARLPVGWIELHSDDGTPYYVNEADGTSSWERPVVEEILPLTAATTESLALENEEGAAAVSDDPDPAAGGLDDEAAPEQATLSSAALPEAATTEANGPLPEGWAEALTDDGVPYYVNQADGTSTWDRPTLSLQVEEGKEEGASQEMEEPDTAAAAIASTGAASYPDEKNEQNDDENERNDAAAATDAAAEASATLPDGWVVLHTSDGTPYYLNEADGTTSWNAPPVAVTGQEFLDETAVLAAAAASPDDDTSLPAVQASNVDEAEEVAVAMDPSSPDDAMDVTGVEANEPHHQQANHPTATNRDTAADLPQGWVEVLADDGVPYYVNEEDGTTTWDRPACPNTEAVESSKGGEDTAIALENENEAPESSRVVPEPSAAAGADDDGDLLAEAGEDAQDDTDVPAAATDSAAILPQGWVAYCTDDGTPYYMNEATGTTSWDPPVAALPLVVDVDEPNGAMDDAPPPPHEATVDNAVPKISGGVVGDEVAAADVFVPVTADDNALPAGWIELSDNGVPFYMNEVDGTTSWDRPIAANQTAAVESSPTGGGIESAAMEVEEVAPDPVAVESAKDTADELDDDILPELTPLPEGWVELNDDGIPYYMNEVDNTTSWDRPIAVNQTAAVESPAGEINIESVVVEEEEVTALDPVAESASATADDNDDIPELAPLPQGWVELKTDDGTPYYLNEANGTTSWDRPVAVEELGSQEPVLVEESDVPVDGQVETDAHAPNFLPLPEGWIEVHTDDGTPYYVSDIDGSTTWDRPTLDDIAQHALEAEAEPQEEPAAAGASDDTPKIASLPEGWIEMSADDGTPYFFYEADGTTSWERPLGNEIAGDLTDESEKAAADTEDVLRGPVEYVVDSGVVDPIAEPDDADSPGLLQLPPGWTELQSDDGTPYFLCESDGSTTWDRPLPNEQIEPHSPGKIGSPHDNGRGAEDELNTVEVFDAAEARNEVGYPVLPAGWAEIIDGDSGTPYYLYEPDGTTTWDRPTVDSGETITTTDIPTEAIDMDGERVAAAELQSPVVRTNSTSPAEGVVPMDSVPEDVANTEVNVYDMLDSAADDSSDGAKPSGSLPPGWVELVDEASGNTYYLFVADNTATWERPSLLTATFVSADNEGDVCAAVRDGEGPEDTNTGAPEDVCVDSSTSANNFESAPEDALEDEDSLLQQANRGSSEDCGSLPPGWTEHVDEASNVPYFLFEADGTTTWNRPTSSENESATENGIVDLGKEGTVPILNDGTAPATQDKEIVAAPEETGREQEALPPGWSKCVDPSSGNPYYVDEATGTTSWDFPVGKVEESFSEQLHDIDASDIPQPSIPSDDNSVSCGQTNGVDTTSPCEPESDLPSGWVEVSDPTSGKTYFYNEIDNNTTWERPALVNQQNGYHTGEESRGLSKHGRPAHTVVSFGFSGRLCIVRPKGKTPCTVAIEPVHTFIPKDRLSKVETSKCEKALVGPLILSNDEAVARYIQDKEMSTDLLWSLISTLAASQGRLRSREGVSDPNSPEAAVVRLLLEEYGQVGANGEGTAAPVHSDIASETGSLKTVEKFLLLGDREQAVEAALSSGNFPIAILIATMCSHEVYQYAVKRYADQILLEGQPLHTLALLFSRQLQSPEGATASMEHWDSIEPKVLQQTWKSHLAAIMSNPTPGWDQIVLALGNRLTSVGEIMAAHFCYMVCGCSVGKPTSPESRMTLLGCDFGPLDFVLASNSAIEAFERTEAFEWAKRRGNANASIPSLQPFKVMYATLLADFGFTLAAKSYIENTVKCMGCSRADMYTAGPARGSLALAMLTSDRNGLLSALGNLELRLSGRVPEPYQTAEELNGQHATSPIAKRMEETDVDSSFVTAHTNFNDAQLVADGSEKADPLAMHQQQNDSTRAARPFAPLSANQSAAAMKPSEVPGQPTSRGPPKRPSGTLDTAFDPADDAKKSAALKTPENFPITPVTASTDGPTKAKKPQTAPMSAPAHLESSKKESSTNSSSKKKGLLGGLKDRMTKWRNPDATNATLGDAMAAYYDNDKKVWVFPGEDPAEVAKPIGPPPTTPLAEAIAPAPAPPANDPLAAMMAPPRRGPVSSRSKSAGMTSPASMPVMFPPGMMPLSRENPPNFSVFAKDDGKKENKEPSE